MRKRHSGPVGRIEVLKIKSKALSQNLLGDPLERDLLVYLPPHFNAAAHYPLIVEFAAYSNSGLGRLNWRNFGENDAERLDRLIAEGMPPVIVAFPDCFTRLGGNQYVNSLAMGNYETHILEEIVPLIETTFNCGGLGKRGCMGKSSGGYGAIFHGIKHADFWSAIACQSGDMAFDLVYLPSFPKIFNYLSKFDYSIENFITSFESRSKLSGIDIETLNMLAMAASYDPNPSAFLGIQLPVNPHSLEIIPERWQAWLKYDPLNIVQQHGSHLRQLKLLFIDCGSYDQYHLHYGARRLIKLLKTMDIPHMYEEFPDDHSSLDYRLDRSFPLLSNALHQ
ncbi:alpha/beta hydrolase [Candidatus Nucleicultrix amoebiphila]|jgi:enterochelin esterase-like enzyme|uniref:Enterochelin esterase n=1 Tax=Candidatus Nucleicultrix amoebiphila FS5 TaxID=1414854 RepID=A0A1W6N422_9PROT|nr:alpha/beta hydrolase-fold protein [Candidatus Nucleicultrix amoebiphila]ARN84605.1 hypothetical protein GQ61_03950 [Candidatus Nucleicultrix amoebiphila FS5]